MTPEQLEQLKARATRPRRTVPLVLNGDLRQRIEDLEVELDDAGARAARPTGGDRRLASRPVAVDRTEAAAIEERLQALHDQAAQDTLTVTLEGMQGTTYRALLAAHPPRTGADGKVLPEDAVGANEETIRRPIVRACIIGLDDDTVEWLLDFVTDRQMDKLVAAAFQVCRGDDAVPLQRTRSTTLESDGA